MAGRVTQNAVIFFAAVICSGAILAQGDLSGLLLRFQTQSDPASKEAILRRIIITHPDSGPALLKVARETKDMDTRWLAIRGIGDLKFAGAAPFLKQSLLSNAHYVRANAARALGEMHDSSAVPDLVRAMKKEEDDGVIEQSAVALQMLGASEALPVLEAKVQNRSVETLVGILGAVDALGSKAEVPFFARFLNDGDEGVAEFAAHAIERLTGEDFGFPKCNTDLCTADPNLGVATAQQWWSVHKQEWKR
jgi:HEAT repeat protein